MAGQRGPVVSARVGVRLRCRMRKRDAPEADTSMDAWLKVARHAPQRLGRCRGADLQMPSPSRAVMD
jgi:hypothetical protein